jgi:uncharacterized phage protein (TIGR02220 family)
MSGRIRSIKPEWLDDQKMSECGVHARLLSVALILLADDQGNGRGHPLYVAGQVFHSEPDAVAVTEKALGELEAIGFIKRYSVRGQDYFAIINWTKHQRVDHPGKPRVPGPEDAEPAPATAPKAVYFIRGATTGLIKIGESVDPVVRLAELARCGSESLELLAILANGSRSERELHEKHAADRVHGEWFRPSASVLESVREAGGNPDSALATAGYDNGKRVLATTSRTAREPLANDSRLTPTPTSDQDLLSCEASASRPLALESPDPGADRKAPRGETRRATETVLAHLNARTGRRFTASEPHVDLVKARMAGGATVDDLKAVIDAKVCEWQADEKMARYLRPDVLFSRKHFATYLDEARGAGAASAPIAAGSPSTTPCRSSSQSEWSSILNLAQVEDEMLSRGERPPWWNDPRRRAMVEDGCLQKLRPVEDRP